MTRQNKILIFGSLGFFGSLYFIHRSIKRNQVYNILISELKSTSVNIDNSKVNEVLNGIFHTNLDSSKSFIKLTETKIRDQAEKIDNAIKGTFTDEEGVYQSFGELKDKIAISQVASYYKAKYGKSLLTQAKDKLSTKELNTLFGIINSKPDVRWLN